MIDNRPQYTMNTLFVNRGDGTYAEIAQLAQRLIDTDAEGVKVGADSLDAFRRVCEQLAGSEADEARRAVLVELAAIQ